MRRKSHSPLFPPFTMYLLIAEKALGKEMVVDWLVTQSPPAEIGSSGWNRAVHVEQKD